MLQPTNKQLRRTLETTPMRTRSFQYELLKEEKTQNKMFWKNLIEFQTMSRGDYFAGRAVLGEEIGKDDFEFQEFLKKLPKAKLSVVILWQLSTNLSIFEIIRSLTLTMYKSLQLTKRSSFTSLRILR